jgi:hypothetical protein
LLYVDSMPLFVTKLFDTIYKHLAACWRSRRCVNHG